MWVLWFFLVQQGAQYQSPDFDIESASIRYQQEERIWAFSMNVKGTAGGTVPKALGKVDGAGVLAYVFVTNLNPKVVGFRQVEGILALAVTSHPDFDDTPLWDEDLDGDYANDGVVYHTHWVVLEKDERVPGGLAVVAAEPTKLAQLLPPTNPGMPMYMDSPGFEVGLGGQRLSVFVPKSRMQQQTPFGYDAVTAYLQVSTDGSGPMLGVYQVFSILSGDLSLPYHSK